MRDIALQGIYPPIPTFFDTHDELDIATYQRHIARLAGGGIRGYVVMGSNGEAVHLNSDERATVIEVARQAAGDEALIVAGCGEQSTRATIRNCEQAARSGADVALVLPPFYYKNRMGSQALLAHYRDVADSSPLPLVIYNMPANTAGIDLDAATICALAGHSNIIGVKDSAANMAKLAQIVASTSGTGEREKDFSVYRHWLSARWEPLPRWPISFPARSVACRNSFLPDDWKRQEACRQDLFPPILLLPPPTVLPV